MEATSRDVFLVVYAVFWAASTPTFSRLRIFSTSSMHAVDPFTRTFAKRRFVVGTLAGNCLPILALATVWSFLPRDVSNFLGVVGGAVAGLTATAFPRLLHGLLASDEWWRRNYSEVEWKQVMRNWNQSFPNIDAEEAEDIEPADVAASGVNTAFSHLWWFNLQLFVPMLVGITLARLAI